MLTKTHLIDHCRGLLGLPNIIHSLSECSTPLEWDDSVVANTADLFECDGVCHSLNVFLAALTDSPYPRDGFCMSDLLRYYIYQQWNVQSHFYGNKVWKEIVNLHCDKRMTCEEISKPSCRLCNDLYMMAFVDLMTNLHVPVVIRLYIGPKMIGRPLLIAPDIMNHRNESDIGPHHTLDLCCMGQTYSLMKTSSMTTFKHFSSTCAAKRCLEKPPVYGLDDIRKFWV